MSRMGFMQPSSRLGAAQEIAFGAVSTASSALANTTFHLRLAATSACRIRIGDGTPTATATDTYLPADRPEYFTCTAAPGKLSLTELA
jgi:hypothetical protein